MGASTLERNRKGFKIQNCYEFCHGIEKCQFQWLQWCNKQSTSYDFNFFKKYWKLDTTKDFKVILE